jgi:hypothetical protein
VATAARGVADGASEGLPDPWPRLVRDTASSSDAVAADRLDRAVSSADLHSSTPRWWRLAGALQRLFALAVAAGALWLLALAVLGYLRIDDVVPVPELRDVPVPTLLLLGGAGAGILLAALARLVNGVGARRRARAAERSLRAEVETVAEELVLGPVEAELDAYRRFCEAVTAARGRPRSRLPLR